MQNSVSFEINVLVSCFVLGLVCGIIFDFFKAARLGKFVKTGHLIMQDIVYYCIISVIVFHSILRVNGAEIRGYMPVSAITAFILYRFLLSNFFVRILRWLYKLAAYMIKMVLLPARILSKILILPFLKIKHKLLSKKAKIALTFKRFCFKIKCKVGMLCIGKNNCKERKPCQREQRPGKKV